MELSYYKYKSSYTDKVNRYQDLGYSGVLLKITNDKGLSGYASYHALNAFGDLPADKFIKAFEEDRLNEQHQLVLLYLQQDLQNRQHNTDALAGAFQIENHKLISDVVFMDKKKLREYQAEQFCVFKIKMGRDIEAETKWLQEHSTFFAENRLKLRLDFNEFFDSQSFDKWSATNKFHEQGIIDYYEDPCVYDVTWWKQWKLQGMRLARDCHFSDTQIQTEGVQVFVLKPALINVVEWLKKLENAKDFEYVITHYMDSPLGVAQAAANAMKLKFFVGDRLLACGLAPTHVIDSLAWNIPRKGPHLLFNDDIGIGFTQELEKIEWSPLKYRLEE